MQKILLLEDDRNLNRGISLKLEKEGYQVFSAFSAKEAEELFDATGPDLIISDVNLPDKSGLDFCREIRKKSQVYLIFLTALEMKLELWGLGLIILGFLLLARAVIIHVDWSLLLVFMVMFIDVHLLTQLPALHQVLSGVGQLSAGGLWLSTIGLSQFISNVPATILLLNYVPPSPLLAWAVNVGGFGLLPGSLANLIALRMASDRRIWWRFHLYSLPLLLWAALVGYALLSEDWARNRQNHPIRPFRRGRITLTLRFNILMRRVQCVIKNSEIPVCLSPDCAWAP